MTEEATPPNSELKKRPRMTFWSGKVGSMNFWWTLTVGGVAAAAYVTFAALILFGERPLPEPPEFKVREVLTAAAFLVSTGLAINTSIHKPTWAADRRTNTKWLVELLAVAVTAGLVAETFWAPFMLEPWAPAV